MMDCFNVIEFQVAPGDQHDDPMHLPLSTVKVTKVNVNIIDAVSYDDPDNITEFRSLHIDITKEKIMFTKMLQQIVKLINDMMVNFVNVTLVCEDIKFFTEIIPRECQRRDLAVPYVFMNFLDIKEIVRNSYFCPFRRLSEIVQFLKICPLREAETKSQTELIEKILRRIHKDKMLLSTSQRFAQRCRRLLEEISRVPEIKFKYYKIIGLPFKSFQNEVISILAPEVPEDRKEICFIYDGERFTGRAVIKIPEDYEAYLVAKNRMYIGQRYIELEACAEGEFQKAKIRLENRPIEKSSPPVMNRDPRQGRGFYKQGHERRPRSRSPQERQRSRQRPEHFRGNDRPAMQPHHQHSFQGEFQKSESTSGAQYGIKIRGLPFAFSQWDVQNVFTPYNIIKGTVKLGLKAGTTFKNGQAVILMRNYNDAQRSLGMNGYRCMGRYLEVMVIGKDDYLRYK